MTESSSSSLSSSSPSLLDSNSKSFRTFVSSCGRLLYGMYKTMCKTNRHREPLRSSSSDRVGPPNPCVTSVRGFLLVACLLVRQDGLVVVVAVVYWYGTARAYASKSVCTKQESSRVESSRVESRRVQPKRSLSYIVPQV
mmetsp:Transcript_6088/g.14145  ORF Transcript_6088/g.14145 Transcript_6088/m.14145 type:complete len:140 (-) Transcript_6088:1114-1533(-)